MANILFIYGLPEPAVTIPERFFLSFSKKYKCGFHSKQAKFVGAEDLAWSDVVICVRGQSVLEAGIISLAKKRGRLCACLIDDNFFAIKDHSFRRPLEEKALLEILKNIDVLLCTNDILGGKLCKLGNIKRYVRIDTSVCENEIYKRNIVQNDNINVVYYSNDGTSDAFEKIICPILPRLFETYADKIQWTFFSAQPDFKGWEKKMKVEYVSRLSLDEFRSRLRKGAFNIGVAPLQENEFTECKYINKFMEFTTAGIPGIYSAVEPYVSFIKDGKTGLLCDNSPNDWLRAFEIMSNPEQRKKIMKNAQTQLKEEFSEQRIFERMRRDFPELVNYKAPHDIEIGGMKYIHMRSLIYKIIAPFIRAWRRFKLEGIKSVCAWTWQHYICRK